MYVDASPRPAIPAHCGSGDQNCDRLAADTMDSDSSDAAETDLDLSIVGTSLQKQQEESH